jgi:uncharacterized membrane protein
MTTFPIARDDVRGLAVCETAAWRGERLCRLALWLSIGIYVFLQCRVAWSRQEAVFGFDSGFDIAIFDQATWLISRGQTPFISLRGLHILADHFSLILYLLAPLYWIHDDPKTLLTFQSVALALGALPVYSLSHEKLKSPYLGVLMAGCYLCYPALQWANAYEFHPDTIATPLFLGAFWSLFKQRWVYYGVFLGLAALTKETFGLTCVFFGAYVILLNRRAGLWTIAGGFLALAVSLGTVRYFNGGVASGYFWLYAKYGNSVPSIAGHLLSHPAHVAIDVSREDQRRYMMQLLQPLCFLPLLAPEILAIAVPAMLANILSSRFIMHSLPGGYYSSLITPFLFLAAITGFDRLQQRIGPAGKAVVGVNLGLWTIASVSLGALWVFLVPTPPAKAARQWDALRDTEARRLLTMIPRNASVSAQIGLVSRLSHRQKVYTFPNPFFRRAWGNTIESRREMEEGFMADKVPPELAQNVRHAPVEYVMICPSVLVFPLNRAAFIKTTTALVKSEAYGIIGMGKSCLLLRRGADYRRGWKLLQRQTGLSVSSSKSAGAALALWFKNQPPHPKILKPRHAPYSPRRSQALFSPPAYSVDSSAEKVNRIRPTVD